MPSAPRAYTVGHSNRSLQELLHTLLDAGVEVLADVRRWPKSRFPRFSAHALQPALLDAGVHYVHLPGLGGKRDVAYAAWMRDPRWRADYAALKALARSGATAIMCAERAPERCHRLHVARALQRHGWRVTHLLGPGEAREMAPERTRQATLGRYGGADAPPEG